MQRTFDSMQADSLIDNSVEPEPKRARKEEEEEKPAYWGYVFVDPAWNTGEVMWDPNETLHQLVWPNLAAFVNFWRQSVTYRLKVYRGCRMHQDLYVEKFAQYPGDGGRDNVKIGLQINSTPPFEAVMDSIRTFKILSNGEVVMRERPQVRVDCSRMHLCFDFFYLADKIVREQERLAPLETWIRGAISPRNQQSSLHRFNEHILSAFAEMTREIFKFVKLTSKPPRRRRPDFVPLVIQHPIVPVAPIAAPIAAVAENKEEEEEEHDEASDDEEKGWDLPEEERVGVNADPRRDDYAAWHVDTTTSMYHHTWENVTEFYEYWKQAVQFKVKMTLSTGEEGVVEKVEIFYGDGMEQIVVTIGTSPPYTFAMETFATFTSYDLAGGEIVMFDEAVIIVSKKDKHRRINLVQMWEGLQAGIKARSERMVLWFIGGKFAESSSLYRMRRNEMCYPRAFPEMALQVWSFLDA